ncbi:hypothetical protein [uncultured Microscilla sp.]|uniref:hypothetical protein n=1 Tax=uncultured Microscilla sp. TaxID=432653 RepID=UPI0026178302|nr:hypothetical protein [uncultured Microscilla sp.]
MKGSLYGNETFFVKTLHLFSDPFHRFLPQVKGTDLTNNYRVRPEPATFLKVLDEEGAVE